MDGLEEDRGAGAERLDAGQPGAHRGALEGVEEPVGVAGLGDQVQAALADGVDRQLLAAEGRQDLVGDRPAHLLDADGLGERAGQLEQVVGGAGPGPGGERRRRGQVGGRALRRLGGDHPAGDAVGVRVEREGEPVVGRAAGQERGGLLGEHRGPVAVLVHRVGEPGQDGPRVAADQVLAADVQEQLAAAVDVAGPAVGVEREDAVAQPLDGGGGGGARTAVEDGADQVRAAVRAGGGHPAPEFDGVRPALPVGHPDPGGQHPAVLQRGAGGGPELGPVGGRDPLAEGGRPAVEARRGDAEDLAHLVVGGHRAGGEVPVEESDPGDGDGGCRELDDRRLPGGLDPVPLGLQPGERGAEAVGDVPQVPPGAVRHPAVRGGPQCGQHAEGVAVRPDRHAGGGEVVRHADGQLREAPHGLLGVGEGDGAPGAVGDGDGQRPGDGDPLHRAEQRQRHTGDGGEHQRTAVARVQVDHAAVGVGACERLAHGCREQYVDLVRGGLGSTRPRTVRWGALRLGTAGHSRAGPVRRYTLAHLFLLRRG